MKVQRHSVCVMRQNFTLIPTIDLKLHRISDETTAIKKSRFILLN